MKRAIVLLLIMSALPTMVFADVWKWVDDRGNTHYVDSNRPIYTWADDNGKTHYSDKPDHEGAISVQLIWVSAGSLADVSSVAGPESTSTDGDFRHADEMAGQHPGRTASDEYYCERAKEAYASYLNAPQLYRAGENGERVYLSDAEAQATIEDTKVKIDGYCN
jgi:hypothetical protein